MFYVSRLQRFADNPCDDVYKYALQVLKYCIRDKVYGIAWSRCNEEAELELSVSSDEMFVSVDSSWQVHDKSIRSRSTTGMVFFWFNGPISVRCMVRGSSLDSGTNSTSPKTRPKLFSGGIADCAVRCDHEVSRTSEGEVRQ